MSCTRLAIIRVDGLDIQYDGAVMGGTLPERTLLVTGYRRIAKRDVVQHNAQLMARLGVYSCPAVGFVGCIALPTCLFKSRASLWAETHPKELC